MEISNEDIKLLKYNHGVDFECLLEKMSTSHNNPEKSSTTNINEYTHSGYSLFTHCSFDATK